MTLVTGATGTNGSELIKLLSERGAKIRGMSRKPSRGPKLNLEGIEFVAADFDDPASVRRALEKVERAFLVTPSTEHVETQQLSFIELARAAGVRHVVYLSQLHSRKQSPVRFLRYHAVVEDALAASGMTFTNLRPNLFMQGLLAFRETIVGQGKFFAAAADAKVSAVDVRDIAAVAAAALTQDGHEEKTYDLTGPEALTHGDMAQKLSNAVGREIQYVDIPEEAMRRALLGVGLPQWQVDGFN